MGFGWREWIPSLPELSPAHASTIRHHAALNQPLGLELRRPPMDSTIRHLFLQVAVAEICRQLQVWMLAQIPIGASRSALRSEGKP